MCPKFDIFIKDSKAILLVDGWDITELIEEDVIEKIEQEEEEEKQE